MRRALRRRLGRDTACPLEAALILRRLLKACERGELDAPPTMIAYLAGALASAEGFSEKTA